MFKSFIRVVTTVGLAVVVSAPLGFGADEDCASVWSFGRRSSRSSRATSSRSAMSPLPCAQCQFIPAIPVPAIRHSFRLMPSSRDLTSRSASPLRRKSDIAALRSVPGPSFLPRPSHPGRKKLPRAPRRNTTIYKEATIAATAQRWSTMPAWFDRLTNPERSANSRCAPGAAFR